MKFVRWNNWSGWDKNRTLATTIACLILFVAGAALSLILRYAAL